VIVLTAHFGNWELFAYAHGLFGFPITLVHRAMRNPFIDTAIVGTRTRGGTHCIAKKAAARNVVRALRHKEMVAIPADQNQTRRFGVFVDFFGKTASTTPGPARLAMLTGAAVFPAFLVREGEGERHRIMVLPEIEMVKTGNREADIVTNTQRCNSVLEQMIRKHPDHWLWLHKRWRTQPAGEPNPYARSGRLALRARER
jgi:KDO2-lipid IV(A) lauroyltransferase